MVEHAFLPLGGYCTRSCGFTSADSVVDNHGAPDVAGVGTHVLAAATGVLLLGQADFLEHDKVARMATCEQFLCTTTLSFA